MESTKTVHIRTVIEARIPQEVSIRDLWLGLASAKIINTRDGHKAIDDAEILTWWVLDVTPTVTKYVTCPMCNKIGLIDGEVVLDGKPLCILCGSKFQHGDLPTPRTPEDLKRQLAQLSQ